MADFTTSALEATAAAIVTATLAASGVEPQALVYAGFGATIGMGATPPAGRLRAVCMFAAITLLCAALGTFVEHHWYPGERSMRNFMAGVSAALAYPVLGAVMANVPPFIAEAFNGLLRLLKLKS